jgi:hypothetical protein
MPRIAPRHHVAAKLILVLALGALTGVAYRRSVVADYQKYQALTLEDYTANFESYRASLYQPQYPWWGYAGIVAVGFLALFGTYELLALGGAWALSAVFPRRAPPPPDQGHTAGELFHAPPATSRFHANLGRIALGVGAVLLATIALAVVLSVRTYEVPEGTDIFAVVEGRWAWTNSEGGCATDAHTISFSPDRRQMFIASARPFRGADSVVDSTTLYHVREHTRNRIRGAIPGETRRTEGGAPVVWDLVLRGPDRYAWRRADVSSPFAFSTDIVRCPGARQEPNAGPHERR